MHTMQYYSGFTTEENSETCYLMDDPGGHYANRNERITKGQKQYDSTYMSHIEKSNPETESRRVILCWGEKGMRKYCLVGVEFGLQDERSSGHGWWRWVHYNVYISNATELYTQK